jgi:peroxiredoxin Q/BCP
MTDQHKALPVWRALVVTAGLMLASANASIFAQENELKTGDTAPSFSLVDQHGRTHALADYRGRWVVLYFYPRDDTPGCTTEACRFRDEYKVLLSRDAQVLGVSNDDRESHERFAKKYSLPFPLLADTDGEASRAYGSYWSLGPVRFARRHTFIIDPAGRVAEIWRKVDPDRHSAEILAALEKLQAGKN